MFLISNMEKHVDSLLVSHCLCTLSENRASLGIILCRYVKIRRVGGQIQICNVTEVKDEGQN